MTRHGTERPTLTFHWKLDYGPVPAEIDDAELERRLFTPAGFHKAPTRAAPDWNHVHAELRRRGVTLLLLWEEYRAEQPEGYGYSRFCGLYIEWRRGVSATMRQTHVAGEKLFVDYAGDTVPVFDGATGEERRAHVFVAVLGASNYTYAEARWSEGLADWVGAHVNALAFIGGVPKLLVCDNLRCRSAWKIGSDSFPLLFCGDLAWCSRQEHPWQLDLTLGL